MTSFSIQNPYRAAEINRLTKHLPTYAMPAREEMRGATLAILRTRSRFVIRNVSLAAGYVRTCINRVVGPNYHYQPRMRMGNDFLEVENDALEAIGRQCDRKVTVQGHTLKQMGKILLYSFIADGEVFAVKTINPKRGPIAREWQIVHADQVAENVSRSLLTGVPDDHTVNLGCEKDPAGRVVAWHFFTDGADVYGFGMPSRQTRRVLAEDVLHWYEPTFADVPRSAPRLTPIILDIADGEELVKATLTKAWREACLTALMTADAAAEAVKGADAETEYDDDGYSIQTIPTAAGEINVIDHPGDITVPESHSPSNTYVDFMKSVERRMGRGSGMSYEKFSGDFSGVSFAGGRLLELDDRAMFAAMADDMDEALMRPIYEDRIDMIYDVHRLRPQPETNNAYSVLISHPVPDWVDPLAQARANKTNLEEGATTLHKICAANGWEYNDHLKELEKEAMDRAALAAKVAVAYSTAGPASEATEEEEPTRSEQEKAQEAQTWTR